MSNKLDAISAARKLDAISAARKILDEIEAEILNGKKEDAPWPQEGDEYWLYHVIEGRNLLYRWENLPSEKRLLAAGLIHRTEKDALVYREWLSNPRTQARYQIEMCDGYSPNGAYELKWRDGGGVLIQLREGFVFDAGARFSTSGLAQACIDKLGVDVIKTALGVSDE